MIRHIKQLTIILVFAFSLLGQNAAAEETVVIKVQKGENLIHICEEYLEYKKDWDKIAKINRLANPNRIYPGQYLVIPVEFLKGIPLYGSVTFVKGVVEVYDADQKKWKTLALNDSIHQGEKIRTAVDSALEISYQDGITLLLRENTIVAIAKTRSKSLTKKVYDFFLDIGRAVNNLRKATGKEIRYKIHTPTTVAAARGTDFRVSVDKDSATRLEVLQGNVGVRSGKQEINIPAGYGALVAKGMAQAQQNKLLAPPSPTEILPLYRSMPMKFFFTPVTGADSMRIFFARDAGFKDIVKEKRIAIDEPFEVVGVGDGVYYLGGRSIDRYGLEGSSSEPVQVRVRVNPLPPFIKAPVNGAKLKKRECKLAWLQVSDAVKYHIQIAEDPDFSRIIIDNSEIGKTDLQTASLEYKTYYFRLRSIAADDYEGIWSDVGNFTLVPPPPAPPLEPPELGKDDIRIRWQDLGKGMTYRFQLAGTSDFKDPAIDRETDTPEITIKRPEKPGTYYVRTLAMDADGYTGAFSAPQSFEIERDYSLAVGILITVIMIAIAL